MFDDSTPASRTSGMVFRPPLPTPWFQKAINFFMPWIFQQGLNGFRVTIDEASLARLQAIKGKRTLLLPNHPSPWDPWVLADIGRRLGEHFYFVAAREVFDYHHGIQGMLLQRMGVYSLVRGASDKDSFRTTKRILADNLGRLVIFVEGEISNQNDSLLPLEPGVLQLAFLAMQDVYKRANKDLAAVPDFYICPVAIKYFYDAEGLSLTIRNAVEALEKAVGITPDDLAVYPRLRAIGFRILEESAAQFGCPLDPEASLDARIRTLEDFMLRKLEGVLNLPYDAALSYLDRVRRIRNVVDRVLKDVPEEQTAYEVRLYDHQKAVLDHFYYDLDRIVNFIAIYDGYMLPEMLPERTIEVIRRLEKEVFGTYRLSHPRTAVASIPLALNLRDHFEAYLADKKGTAEALVREIERALFAALQAATPVVAVG